MKNYDFLIIGSNGLLGSKLVKNLLKINVKFFTVARNKSDFNIDLNYYKKLNRLFIENKFKIVINCAAIVDINFCEHRKKEAAKINTKLVKYLSEKSKLYKYKLVQISTDHVYGGNKKRFNKEISKLFPVNNYAKTKIDAEKFLLKLKKFLIIRTNFTGRKKGSFIDWIINNIRQKKNIYLFNDMYTSTLDVNTCSKFIIKLSMINSKGIFNLGSRDELSKEEFGIKVAKYLKKKIIYKSMSCDIQKVKRGKFLSLDVKKIERKLSCKMPTSNKSIVNLLKEYK